MLAPGMASLAAVTESGEARLVAILACAISVVNVLLHAVKWFKGRRPTSATSASSTR